MNGTNYSMDRGQSRVLFMKPVSYVTKTNHG